MQYIDFTEDILKPLSQHEIGFENGFALSQFDPNVAGYYENQFPEGFPIDTLSARFLSLQAEDQFETDMNTFQYTKRIVTTRLYTSFGNE